MAWNPNNAGAGSYDYMHLMGLTALGYMWAKIVKSVLALQAKGESNPALDANTDSSRSSSMSVCCRKPARISHASRPAPMQ